MQNATVREYTRRFDNVENIHEVILVRDVTTKYLENVIFQVKNDSTPD